MEKTYVGCRYGAMDGTPDMKGVQTKSDAPSCKELSKCPGYGSVCRIPENLTRQEYQVAVFIGRGKMDKEICDIMNIAQPTLRTYIARIHDKLSINNRIEIALWAQNLSIC
jgi:DNA-binding NarL/FixJ family response regulator